ncbi:MAG: pseudouridine synthase [Nitrospirota bacterium]
MRSLSILYHDEHLVAVNKPAGLLVHRSFIDRRETEYAMQVLRDQLGQWVYPLHRLDKATSGVLVFALDKETARRMTEVFTGGSIVKSYLAVVRGFTDVAGRIEHPLKEPRDRMTDRRADPDAPAREAVTEYRRLATVDLPQPVGRYATARFSLITANPRTGRMHQIRRHLKHIFHPVVGDTTYGDGRQNEFFREQFQCRRLLLHASQIAFPHPLVCREVTVSAPPDEALSAVLENLFGHAPP